MRKWPSPPTSVTVVPPTAAEERLEVLRSLRIGMETLARVVEAQCSQQALAIPVYRVDGTEAADDQAE